MKPQITQGKLTKLFYKINRYAKYSITVGAVESWNKIQKQLKDILLKIYPPRKLKQLLVIFILNQINSSRVGIKKKIFCEKIRMIIMFYAVCEVGVQLCCDHKYMSRFKRFKEQQKIHIFV